VRWWAASLAAKPAVLVDECLPFDVTLAFRQRGFDVTDIFERGLRGLDDLGVWALSAGEKASSDLRRVNATSSRFFVGSKCRPAAKIRIESKEFPSRLGS
jgi:hypothetical protein